MCGTRESWDTQVRLKNMKIRTLEVVLQFIYNDKVRITGDNVQDVLSAAEMMDLGDLKRMALRFMTSHINSSNCLAVWQVSELFSCNIAAEEAKSFALKNFKQVTLSPEFLRLSAERLKTLISDDMLRVEDETVVLGALDLWLKQDKEDRRSSMQQLLNSVRWVHFYS